MRLSLFDLHCDTAHRMLSENQPLRSNSFAVSLENAEKFEVYTQIMALWPHNCLCDEEAQRQVFSMLENLKNDPSVLQEEARITKRFDELTSIPNLFLSIEDARILAGNVDGVDRLYSLGVRFLTPLWKGHTCIGGAHDTEEGLTPFGKAALHRAAELGMILDISHASERSANEIFAIGAAHSRPVIASHSNAFEVCPVSRNLKLEQIAAIVSCGGLIGLNLHAPFIGCGAHVKIQDLLPHIEYFLEVGAQNALALGCDMDGGDLPSDLPDLAALPKLAELLLQHGYSEGLVRKIFFENASEFAKKYLN